MDYGGPVFRRREVDRRHTGKLRKRDMLPRGEGEGEKPNQTTTRKPRSRAGVTSQTNGLFGALNNGEGEKVVGMK